MQCEALKYATSNERGDWRIKKGDKVTDFSCLPRGCEPTNFQIPLIRKNWLLKFGFAYRLAQILEPKLLFHEISKLKISFLG